MPGVMAKMLVGVCILGPVAVGLYLRTSHRIGIVLCVGIGATLGSTLLSVAVARSTGRVRAATVIVVCGNGCAIAAGMYANLTALRDGAWLTVIVTDLAVGFVGLMREGIGGEA
ncbi:MAG: hypothetical protein ACYDAR_06480 [Thermomicrobiales bacterium]